ncbi:DNA polymerase III subunit gamma/tau [Paraburkholderia bryophila]|uniref:DNA-directed DNA polymerase n=1 Tax=Paraburkholderia bryophila TaxID=420952 RepID=A0A7Y9WG99_9BURK|nr:DNA polymerase III subunit gamma/tau [Paraburkholderia bryophila]NYH19651.1 DNA polymerase-3 subunit gamma/tau [Paraburkholderia bryophila]
MTYQVLARKWRPKDFASLVGQEHVVRALTHALDGGRLHHAYLFTGTRGVGKTTLSRIFAKALNCETGVTSTPCGVCRACREIDEGRFIDYVEMDAASNRGVDEMAALLERAVYAPVDARFKVYMIDEVHMLTNHAFNAMLKTLEEPPAHVKFILATTDPQKIPVTVLSRCLQFNLKQMPAGHIVSHLEHILGEEKVPFDAQALRLLARAADGSMRDALSLTDQAIAYSANQVNEEAVRGMLGALDQSYLIRLLDALADGDGAAVLAVADEMALRSLSFSTALQDLASLLHRIAWAQFAPSSVLDEWPEAADLRRFAGALSAEHVQLFYQIATIGRSELGLAPDEYAGFTMTLLRMLAFEPAPTGGGGGAVGASRAPGAAGAGGARRAGAPAVAAQQGAMGSSAGAAAVSTAAVASPSLSPSAPRVAPGTTAASATSTTEVVSTGAIEASPLAPWDDAPVESAASETHVASSVSAATAVDVSAASDVSAKAESEVSAVNDIDGTAASDISAAPDIDAAAASEVLAASNLNAPIASEAAAPGLHAPAATEVPPASDNLSAPIAAPASAASSRLEDQQPASSPTAPATAAFARAEEAASAVASQEPSPAAGIPPRRAGGASAALDVLRSAGLKVSSDRGRATAAAAAAPTPKPAAPRVVVPVPTPGAPRRAPQQDAAPATAPRAASPAQRDGAQRNGAEQNGSPVPPWDDMPPDDYMPLSASDDGYYGAPDDSYMPVFDSGPDDVRMNASPAPSPAPAIDKRPLPAAVPLDPLGFNGDWPALAVDLPLKGISYQLAFNSELMALEGNTLKLNVPVPQYAEASQVAKLKSALADKLGRNVEVLVEVGAARRTAAAHDAATRAQRQQEAEREIGADPFVQSLIREFGASIVPGSIRPITPDAGSAGAPSVH